MVTEMSDKQKILAKDLEEGENQDFAEIKETWNTYKLSDGTILKIKLVLRGVKRLKKYDADGTPVYMVNHTTVLRVLNIDKKLYSKSKINTFKPI